MTPEAALSELMRQARIGRAVEALTRHGRYGDLHATDLRLYLALAVLEADSPIRLKAFAIAQLIGRSERNAQRALTRLERHGLIVQHRDSRPHLVRLHHDILGRAG